MVGIGFGFYLQLSGNSKQRIRHPAKVVGVQENTYMGGHHRRAAVEIYGDNLLLAGVEFDGVMLGSWPVDPDPAYNEGRKTVVPLNQGGLANQDEVTARNAFRGDTESLSITGTDGGALPNIDVTVPGIKAYNAWYGLQEAVAVWVVGPGFYPGRATVVNLDAGPSARTVPGHHPALGTKMMGEHALVVFFPRTMPHGSYRIEITNDPVYGAPPVQTNHQFVHN